MTSHFRNGYVIAAQHCPVAISKAKISLANYSQFCNPVLLFFSAGFLISSHKDSLNLKCLSAFKKVKPLVYAAGLHCSVRNSDRAGFSSSHGSR